MSACAFHFGALVPWDEFPRIADRLRAGGVDFVIAPRIRCEGKPGAQMRMFFLAPSRNPIELKAFRNPAEVFAQ
ncbi:MAG TPA: hypothetical protein VLA95_03445 [Gemmatimonadales bacterium]|nr:hypothetical protein [Gemmatimonadales bacterium]